jgi:hypothetical protein
MNQEKDPFVLPAKPKNSWQMVGWAINEYTLLENYSKTLSKKETLFQVLKAYFSVIVPIVILLYLLSTLFVVAIDLPSIIPSAYKADFIKGWSSYSNFLDRFIFFIEKTYSDLAVGLAVG